MTKLQNMFLNDLVGLKNGFSRLLGLGILFIIIGHFFIVEPYFSYKKEQKLLSAGLSKSKDDLEIVKKHFLEIKKVDSQIESVLKEVKRDIQKFPKDLRQDLTKIKKETTSSALAEEESLSSSFRVQTGQYDTVKLLPRDIQTFEKGVHWYTKQQFTKMVNRLQNEIITPLINLDMLSEENQKEKLEQLTKKAIDDIFMYINRLESENPNFWRTFDDKMHIADELDRVVTDSFNPINNEISKSLKKINEVTESRREKLVVLEEDMQKTEEMKKSLENRLNTLQSPIGKIPVGLIDFIKIFPLLILVLMVMIVLHLSKSRYMYEILQKDMPKMDIGEDKTIFNHIINCWYLPPYSNILHYLVLVVAIIFIAAIYIRSTLLVMATPELFFSITDKEYSLQSDVYMVLYFLGTLVLLVSLFFILKAMRKVP
ncbi:hypothetical protein KKC13_12305 [bacterium]|nr:hypothetical protein [bacterium]MBU1958741.1 hypothetical protein [bacterium]